MAIPPVVLDVGQRAATFTALVQHLSTQSVRKHFDAYEDVDWDAPGMALDVGDPQVLIFPFDSLSRTDWFRSQFPEVQGLIGLHRTAYCIKVGWQFENLLQRGLLSYAFRLPNGAPDFRYIHHEVVVESQHSMMFQEVVTRSGIDVRGTPLLHRFLATVVLPPVQRCSPQPSRPTAVSVQSPLTSSRPRTVSPRSVKKAMVASRSRTAMATFSILIGMLRP